MASDWYITDGDCLQCYNAGPDARDRYEFVQINAYPGHVDGKPFYQVAHGSVYLPEYTEAEIIEVLNLYSYDNMDDLILKSNPEGEFVYNEDGSVNTMLSPGYDYDTVHRLLAEMFFETESQEYVVEEFDSWNQAASYVCSIVNLDLQDYYEKTDKDFVLLADPDNKFISITTVGELPQGFFLGGETVRHIPGCIPEYAASYFSQGLDQLKESFDVSSYQLTSGAKAQLPALMEPILQADIGRDRHMFPILAIHWANEHQDYVDALDNIFSTLGLIRVDRVRPSVTQGEAAVFFNGEKIIQYGDDIKLHSNDRDGIFDAVCTDKQLYGPIIGGWGSTKPDSLFRKAALTQYGTDIVRALEQNRSLDVLIGKAQSKVHGNAVRQTAPRESER